MPEHTRAPLRQLTTILVKVKKTNALFACYGASLPSSCNVAKKPKENGHISSNRKRNADVPVLYSSICKIPPMTDRPATASLIP